MILLIIYLLGVVITYWIVDSFHSDWLEDPFTGFLLMFWPIGVMWVIVNRIITMMHEYNPIRYIYKQFNQKH